MQLNIARLTQPIDHPATADFVEALEPINALAERSPGFVWRLQGEGNDATDLRANPDPDVIVNLSVWETPQSLTDFVFRSAHTPFLRRRTEWFTPMGVPQVVAFWVDEGQRPTIDEAMARLEFLTEHGPSPYAFSVTRPLQQFSIRRALLDAVDAVDAVDALSLIAQLNAELDERYPEPGSNHFRLDPAEVAGDNGVFLIASLDAEPVACGAFRVLTPTEPAGRRSAEIKRMYTIPTARGLKIGAAVLAELEQRAAALGVATMQLETGPGRHGAAFRYERAGYGYCDCWGDYAGKPFSVCMSKTLP